MPADRRDARERCGTKAPGGTGIGGGWFLMRRLPPRHGSDCLCAECLELEATMVPEREEPLEKEEGVQ